MKKITCIILTLILAFSTFTVLSLAADTTLTVADIAENYNVKLTKSYAQNWLEDGYISFKNVDFTGVKSIRMKLYDDNFRNYNGEAFAVYLDNALSGECLGYILFNEESKELVEIGMNLKKSVSGKHTLYIKQNYSGTDSMRVESVTLSSEEWNDPKKVTPVSDDNIIDTYADTWTAVDAVGRKLADYEEVGPVKEGTREVLMFYHDWHTGGAEAQIASETFKNYPDSETDYDHSAWHTASIWWSEPVYGFYVDTDYWHYRKAAELMANAGVDAVFLDYTNWNSGYIKYLNVMLKAYHDARADGVDVPKISMYGQMYDGGRLNLSLLKAFYFNVYENEYYSDLCYYVDGKPFVIQNSLRNIVNYVTEGDKAELALAEKLVDMFNYRGTGDRFVGYGWDEVANKGTNVGFWHWLTTYPQNRWGGQREDGRTEMINLGMAINDNYQDRSKNYGVFSDPYTKGRSYSEAFGDDYREAALHEGYFAREQISRVLEEDPWYVMVSEWNEYTTARSKDHFDGKYPNAFIDMLDDNKSRDIEPSKGILKDDYYNMLVDFVRKYKGVRPAPVASEAVTIDITGGLSQWDSVGPEFINHYGGYERDSDGWLKYNGNGEAWHYTTEVVNYILRSKVARDDDNFYFYAKCGNDITLKDAASMNLYINADRNYATGWEGYDLLISGNSVSRFADGAYTLTEIGTAEYKVDGDVIQFKVPKALVGDVAELEFKWTDNIKPDGDLMLFYTEGNAAPVGRFNYLYTTIGQTSLSEEERAALKGTSVLKAGSQKMYVSGGKMNVYDKDIRVTCFEQNGTLYIPLDTVNEILGYGTSKAYYDNVRNKIFIKCFDLVDKQNLEAGDYFEKEIENYQWISNVLGSSELFVDGELTYTTAATAVNGVVYVPAAMLSDGFGVDVKSLGNGCYALSKDAANITVAQNVAEKLN